MSCQIREQLVDRVTASFSLGCLETKENSLRRFHIIFEFLALSKSTSRLRDSLFPRDEPNLAVPLLLLIAQHRSMVVINADVPYIKMVSEQFDRCHGTLLQYVEFLCSAVTPPAYAQFIPSLDDLVHTYHLDPEAAFLIYRPVMRLFKCLRGHEIYWPLSVPLDVENHTTEKELELSLDVLLEMTSPRTSIRWLDLLGIVRTMLPSKVWNSLSPDLYATFWGLTLYDLYVPRNRYESEIAKQHGNLKALEEFSDNSSSAITKRKKDKEKIQELLDKLTAELQKHEEHVASVRDRLSHEKDKWLSSCPDMLKTNIEFLQRCILPRCIFSMLDAAFCAIFVHTLHSLGTPYFNTVNHIDVLLCKTLHPMICCCTEYEAGRLGRFLYETLKMAYRWKSDESIYERECGNMPGFAVYYRFPNSQRVTFSQFVKVHAKWNTRITRVLILCLESSEYMEIRNALITLTKISSVFPVTRKSGVNLEKRVARIKNDEREDLKVLAIGVAAALGARKSSWVSEDEFYMGLIDLKHAASPAKSTPNTLGILQNGSQSESAVIKSGTMGNQFQALAIGVKDQVLRAKPSDGMSERTEGIPVSKPDSVQQKVRVALGNSSDLMTTVVCKPSAGQTSMEEVTRVPGEENIVKTTSKASTDSEPRPHAKRSTHAGLAKQSKQELLKDESRSEKSIGRGSGQNSSATTGREALAQSLEGRQGGAASLPSTNGSSVLSYVKGPVASSKLAADIHGGLPKIESGPTKPGDLRVSGGNDIDDSDVPEKPRPLSSRRGHSPLHDDSLTARAADKQQKRPVPSEELERLSKRRKGDTESKDSEGIEVRISDREKPSDSRVIDKSLPSDHENFGNEEQTLNRLADKFLDKVKDKPNERYDKDHREKGDRPEKLRGEDALDKSRDRSMERYSSERSAERMQERGTDRNLERTMDKTRDERGKDDRSKIRHSEPSLDKSHSDDRFHSQSLPPPPPLPPSFVPQSFGGSRRDEEVDRRAVSNRHTQRLSPKHDEKERRRSEENLSVSHDDAKRRREEDFRDRKRDERDGLPVKVEEREREKGNMLKDDTESAAAASKRRKIKRDHPSVAEAGEYTPVTPPPPPPLTLGISQRFDGREGGERKGVLVQNRAAYVEEPVQRNHAKEAASKITRRDNEQIYEREWEEEKRQRTEVKRKHRK
uniref:THO complex subunit 2 n=1 Tax=Anthurium amnicola TaxID=1678845 RepID=A0A1D1YC63_9ARAE